MLRPDQLPERFSDLDAPEQARLLKAGESMSRLAYSYATSILVAGPPSPNSKLRNGSGFVLRLPQGHWLGTAWHVVQAWQERQESGEEVQFQVGSAVLEPTADRVWVDRPNDIVFVPLEEDQVARIDATPISPSSWPPDLPKQGEGRIRFRFGASNLG